MASPHARSPWIRSAAFDLCFFVGAPLLCLALLLPIAQRVPSLSIYLAVMAFSSFGHHLPGFLRAYGEAEMFRRYRWRFLLAPPLLFCVFLFFGLRQMHGMLLFLMLWSIWHVAMQHFGFMRIYDAKQGQTSRTVARLDRALVLCWFASVVLFSPQYTHDLLANVVDVGASLPAAKWIDGLRFAVFGATGLVSAAWIFVCARLIVIGQPLSRIKIALHVLTIGFLAFVWAGLGDLLLGLAIWEVFHDLQYFAITWVHGERLVKQGLGDTLLTRFLFRGRAPLVLLYVGAIAAYGGLNYAVVTRSVPGSTLHAALMAFVFTSTALHYYYDSFLWKVRDERTRAGLDLDSARAETPRAARGAFAAAAQFAGFALPLGALALVETRAPDRASLQVSQREAIRDVVPDSGAAHRNLAVAYAAAGRAQDELLELGEALRLEPDDGIAHAALGTALLEQFGAARSAEAEAHLVRAMELRPRDPLPGVNLALLRLGEDRAPEAVEIYRTAISRTPSWEPRTPSELTLAGIERLAAQDFAAAKSLLVRALQLSPHDLEALDALRVVALGTRDLALEGEALDALLQAAPTREDLQFARIDQRLRADRVAEAVGGLEKWIVDHPEDLDRKLALAEILATHPDPSVRNGPRARELASEVVSRTQRTNAGALDVLGAAHAECGEFEQARQLASEALALAETHGLQANASAIRARLAAYTENRPHRAGR